MQALQIKSVVVKDGDRGYIYVEAFKATHVKAACEDIRALNCLNIQMVPIKGMTDILRIVKTNHGIRKGLWVRVKQGIYRDDLAKVEDVDHTQNLATLKLIPRVDYSRSRSSKGANEKDSSNIVPELNSNFKKKSRYGGFKRPAAKLFDEETVEFD